MVHWRISRQRRHILIKYKNVSCEIEEYVSPLVRQATAEFSVTLCRKGLSPKNLNECPVFFLCFPYSINQVQNLKLVTSHIVTLIRGHKAGFDLSSLRGPVRLFPLCRQRDLRSMYSVLHYFTGVKPLRLFNNWGSACYCQPFKSQRLTAVSLAQSNFTYWAHMFCGRQYRNWNNLRLYHRTSDGKQ